MLIDIRPDNPDQRKIDQLIQILNNGGLIVVPTDTIYAFAASINSKKGLERLAKIKDVKGLWATLSDLRVLWLSLGILVLMDTGLPAMPEAETSSLDSLTSFADRGAPQTVVLMGWHVGRVCYRGSANHSVTMGRRLLR